MRLTFASFRSIGFTALTLLAVLAVWLPAWATDPTPEQIRCEWKKNRKVGSYLACLQNAAVAEVKNPLFDLDAAKAACAATFETAWVLQETHAANAGEECLDGAGAVDAVRALLDSTSDRIVAWVAGSRSEETGDGTVTDSRTGLQWELKTDDGGVHDKDNTYTWTAAVGGTAPNGTAFLGFLAALNGSVDGACFAGHCDWRLPTIAEWITIVRPPAECGTAHYCTDPAFGPYAATDYWSSETVPSNGTFARYVILGSDLTNYAKQQPMAVRAVRAGS